MCQLLPLTRSRYGAFAYRFKVSRQKKKTLQLLGHRKILVKLLPLSFDTIKRETVYLQSCVQLAPLLTLKKNNNVTSFCALHFQYSFTALVNSLKKQQLYTYSSVVGHIHQHWIHYKWKAFERLSQYLFQESDNETSGNDRNCFGHQLVKMSLRIQSIPANRFYSLLYLTRLRIITPENIQSTTEGAVDVAGLSCWPCKYKPSTTVVDIARRYRLDLQRTGNKCCNRIKMIDGPTMYLMQQEKDAGIKNDGRFFIFAFIIVVRVLQMRQSLGQARSTVLLLLQWGDYAFFTSFSCHS